jgi:hypothetical protein
MRSRDYSPGLPAKLRVKEIVNADEAQHLGFASRSFWTRRAVNVTPNQSNVGALITSKLDVKTMSRLRCSVNSLLRKSNECLQLCFSAV